MCQGPFSLLLLLVLGFPVVLCQGGQVIEGCPVSPLSNDDSNELSLEYHTSRYSNGVGIKLVQKLRTKSEDYYQNVVNNAIMFSCDVESASERCVDQNLAAKSWSGQCIESADHVCPLGLCERSSNCYWNPVQEGENRTTRFDIESYSDAEENLIGLEGSYARDIGAIGMAGIAVTAVLTLMWAVFFVGRYLCCCLWVPCHR